MSMFTPEEVLLLIQERDVLRDQNGKLAALVERQQVTISELKAALDKQPGLANCTCSLTVTPSCVAHGAGTPPQSLLSPMLKDTRTASISDTPVLEDSPPTTPTSVPSVLRDIYVPPPVRSSSAGAGRTLVKAQQLQRAYDSARRSTPPRSPRPASSSPALFPPRTKSMMNLSSKGLRLSRPLTSSTMDSVSTREDCFDISDMAEETMEAVRAVSRIESVQRSPTRSPTSESPDSSRSSVAAPPDMPTDDFITSLNLSLRQSELNLSPHVPTLSAKLELSQPELTLPEHDYAGKDKGLAPIVLHEPEYLPLHHNKDENKPQPVTSPNPSKDEKPKSRTTSLKNSANPILPVVSQDKAPSPMIAHIELPAEKFQTILLQTAAVPAERPFGIPVNIPYTLGKLRPSSMLASHEIRDSSRVKFSAETILHEPSDDEWSDEEDTFIEQEQAGPGPASSFDMDEDELALPEELEPSSLPLPVAISASTLPDAGFDAPSFSAAPSPQETSMDHPPTSNTVPARNQSKLQARDSVRLLKNRQQPPLLGVLHAIVRGKNTIKAQN